jgi:hypothetical protein
LSQTSSYRVGAIEAEERADGGETVLDDYASFDSSLSEDDVEKALKRAFKSYNLLQVAIGDRKIVEQ